MIVDPWFTRPRAMKGTAVAASYVGTRRSKYRGGIRVDQIAELKTRAKGMWAKGAYGEIARNLVEMSAHLVRTARVGPGDRILDLACGTGITAITARLAGGQVIGLDLTPELLNEARTLAAVVGADGIEWREGDAEALPFADASFDVALSSFGHMFAPRPEVTAREMLRVLRPGGRIAFTTWPPEHATGSFFRIMAKHVPPPAGVPSPMEWGTPEVVRQRLGDSVKELTYERGVVRFYALSPAHFWHTFSTYYGPTIRAIEVLGSDGVEAFRQDFVTAVAPFWRNNAVHQDYLLSHAVKV